MKLVYPQLSLPTVVFADDFNRCASILPAAGEDKFRSIVVGYRLLLIAVELGGTYRALGVFTKRWGINHKFKILGKLASNQPTQLYRLELVTDVRL